MERIDWKKWAAIVITVAGGVAALMLFCKLVLVLLLPFVFALLLAFATRRAVKSLSRRTGCPPRISAILVTLGALVLLALLLFVLCNRLAVEVQNLLSFLIEDSENPNGEIAAIVSFFRELGDHLPFLSHLRRLEFLQDIIGDPEEYLINQLREFLSSVAGKLAAGVAAILRRLPGVLLFLLVTLISCFYFAVEYETVSRVLIGLLPPKLRERWPDARDSATRATKRYVRAYFLLFLLTLAQLTIAFFVLCVRYPFLLALLTAFLDILPVLGVGTVLLPWALFSFATGRVARGVGLLVVYAVMTVIRQIAEPHLVGKSLGLHPILMLISFYVGLGLFGVVGLFLGPALALCFKATGEWFAKGQKKKGL